MIPVLVLVAYTEIVCRPDIIITIAQQMAYSVNHCLERTST